MSSARSMQTYQTNNSAAPPARWFMDPPPKSGSSAASTGSEISTTPPPPSFTETVSQLGQSCQESVNEDEGQDVARPQNRGLARGNNLIQMSMRHLNEEENIERPPARRPVSRGISRGNNLIQMSMRELDVTTALRRLDQADRIDEVADMMDSADQLELCEVDLEESSLSTTNSSK